MKKKYYQLGLVWSFFPLQNIRFKITCQVKDANVSWSKTSNPNVHLPVECPAHQSAGSQSACPWIFSVSMTRSHLVVISITMAFSNRGIYQTRRGTSFRQSCTLSYNVYYVKKKILWLLHSGISLSSMSDMVSVASIKPFQPNLSFPLMGVAHWLMQWFPCSYLIRAYSYLLTHGKTSLYS